MMDLISSADPGITGISMTTSGSAATAFSIAEKTRSCPESKSCGFTLKRISSRPASASRFKLASFKSSPLVYSRVWAAG